LEDVSKALEAIPPLPGQSSEEPTPTEEDKVNEALAEAEADSI